MNRKKSRSFPLAFKKSVLPNVGTSPEEASTLATVLEALCSGAGLGELGLGEFFILKKRRIPGDLKAPSST